MAWGTGVCFLTGAASCEYLDVVPVETPDRDDMLTDPASALRYLYGCYGPIQNEKTQKQRIQKRNAALIAQKFFNCWIPLENRYLKECAPETDLQYEV